ncbi:MAG: hypothetical protein P8168_11585 [Deltaproteobacteria bacterium]
MEDHRLWPLKGGTWKERLVALGYLALLCGGLAAIYVLTWGLAPFY